MDTWEVTIESGDEPITRPQIFQAFTDAYPETTEFAVHVIDALSRLPERIAHDRTTAGPDCEGQPHRPTTLAISGSLDPTAPLSITFTLTETA